MRTRKLGWTDLELTTIGLGTWAQGGAGWGFSWGPQDDDASINAILKALDAGINWVDTAAVYGLGHAEEVLGRALKKMPVSERPIVATKCGRRWDENRKIFKNIKADSVRGELEDSLGRLGIDTIDLYQIHWPEPDEDIEEGWGAIAEAVKAGKVRYAGVSNFNVSQIKRLMDIHPVASLQPPYSMLRREVEEEILPFCGENRVGVVAYSPMQKGLLTGKFSHERVSNLAEEDHRRRDPMFKDPELTPTLEMVAELERIAGEHGKTAAQLALAWVLRRPEVTAAIAGARKPQQIQETAAAGDWELSDDVVSRIDELLAERDRKAGK